MKVDLLKKYTFGLGISILLVIVNNGLIKRVIGDISNKGIINLSTVNILLFNPLIDIISLIGIGLIFYFFIKIYTIIFGKEKKKN